MFLKSTRSPIGYPYAFYMGPDLPLKILNDQFHLGQYLDKIIDPLSPFFMGHFRWWIKGNQHLGHLTDKLGKFGELLDR